MDKFSYESICSFLKLYHCPVLEKLFIRVGFLSVSNWFHISVRLKVLSFLKVLAIPKELSDELQDIQESAGVVFSRLRVIKVSNFVGTKLEMSLVGFLLQGAVCLEYLVLVAPNSSEII